MKKHNDIIEKIKIAVIVLLVASAIFLGWESRLFGNASNQLGNVSELFGALAPTTDSEVADAEDQKISSASLPVSIAVTDETGGHYGVKYDLNEIKTLYDNKLVLLFGEALGSAQEPYAISEFEWQNALLSNGVYFEYLSPVKLAVLDGWYGTEITGDWANEFVRRLCVTFNNGVSRLCFLDESTGEFYAADISAKDSVTGLAEAYGINSALFAFELGIASNTAARYTLLLPQSQAHPIMEVSNPLINDKAVSDALEGMGISEHELSTYPQSDGTQVFVGKDFTLSVSLDGTILFNNTDSEHIGQNDMDESAAIELARHAIANSIARFCGDAVVYFDSIRELEDGRYQVFFNYIAAGAVINMDSLDKAAVVTIQNGAIEEMTLRFRQYLASSETVMLPPEIQTAAAAKGAFVLSYSDTGSGNLMPFWGHIVAMRRKQ